MSETMTVPPLTDGSAKRTPTVYFIDDSATMREVIKIAFRRESINVITCADAASAMAQFEQNPPDAVITDVIMPDQDGYAVCTQIKQHPQYSGTPVVLMSGVVNKSVADKAVSVHADELIRKPFQPQELIGRVKALLAPKLPSPSPSERSTSPSPLTGLFAAPSPSSAPGIPFVPGQTAAPSQPSPAALSPADMAWPRALTEAFSPRPAAPAPQQPPVVAALQTGQPQSAQPQSPANRPPLSPDAIKLRGEIARLELLIKKLQTELQIERQYNQALELQIQTLTNAD